MRHLSAADQPQGAAAPVRAARDNGSISTIFLPERFSDGSDDETGTDGAREPARQGLRGLSRPAFGQPSWLIGGNDGLNFYVYNPSNFSVNWANSAGNADTVDGYHAIDLSQIYKGTNQDETNYPIGSYLLVYNGGIVARNVSVGVWLNSTSSFTLFASGAQLSGTWRVRGCLTYSGSNNILLVQRVA